MAVTWEEQWVRDLGTKSAEKLFVGEGGSGDTIEDAYDALETAAPATFKDLTANNIQVKEIEGQELRWLGVVTYGDDESGFSGGDPDPGDPDAYEFDISGSPIHLKQSLATTGVYPAAAASEYLGLINFTKAGVEGLDTEAPTSSFSITRTLTAATVTNAYIIALEDMAYTTNNATFKGRAIGEVLFVGATGKQRADLNYTITFNFKRSKNKGSFVFNPSDLAGNQITVTAGKKGWEYIWPRYEDVPDAVNKRIVKKVVEVRVEKIFEASDFAALGIGT